VWFDEGWLELGHLLRWGHPDAIVCCDEVLALGGLDWDDVGEVACLSGRLGEGVASPGKVVLLLPGYSKGGASLSAL